MTTAWEEVTTDTLALEYWCGYCRQPVGEWCKTSSGAKATWLHSARIWPMHQAWSLGYVQADTAHKEDLRRRTDALRDQLHRHGMDEQGIEEIVEAVMARRWF